MSFYSHAQIPRYKGQGKKKTSGQKSGAKVTCMRAEGRAACGADPAVGPPPGLEFPFLGLSVLSRSLSFTCGRT